MAWNPHPKTPQAELICFWRGQAGLGGLRTAVPLHCPTPLPLRTAALLSRDTLNPRSTFFLNFKPLLHLGKGERRNAAPIKVWQNSCPPRALLGRDPGLAGEGGQRGLAEEEVVERRTVTPRQEGRVGGGWFPILPTRTGRANKADKF